MLRQGKQPERIREAINQYTIGHVASGTILGLARVPWWVALLSSVAFELAEKPLKRHIPEIFPDPRQDAVLNSVFDTVAVMVGWGLIQLFPNPYKRRTG